MDIQREAKKQTTSLPVKLGIGLALLLLLLSTWSFSQPSGSEKIARDKIWTDTVTLGDLVLNVEGYGKLKSKHQRLITAPAKATVEEILLKPGSLVTPDSIIARLSNPEIAQKVRAAKRDYRKANSLLSQIRLKQKREILAHKAMQEELMSALELAELKMLAEQKLMEKGIVSQLTYKRSQLDYRQLSRRIEIEQQRRLQLEEVHEQEIAIEQDKIVQQKENVDVITHQFERLTIKAGIDGVVQNLPVELGQSVALGEQVALVGSVDSLFAMLSVSQSDIERIALNQTVEIDTRSGKIKGKVERVNPLVKQGMVTIEVSLSGQLPKNARPDLNVNGVIATGTLEQVLYIKKPVNVASGMKTGLFKVNGAFDKAQQVQVQFGAENGESIQIISGVSKNERFILSDMSRWQKAKHLTITQ
ncbi:MAG: efflux RND transporter periplasmic adaptor subunit [Colwellia sp.]